MEIYNRKPKWLYRVESTTPDNGLWYDSNGKYVWGCRDCKGDAKDLPMGYDERYHVDGKDWFSACSNKEDLLHWYTLEDAIDLIENHGFVFTRYLAKDYIEYPTHETVFLKDTALKREEIDIESLFNTTNEQLKEARLNSHQQHIESLVFSGPEGIAEINNYIKLFLNRIINKDKGYLNINYKIDGSPAVIIWSKMKGYPKNSICLKSFINGPQNCMSSVEDIDAKYGDRPEMAAKLKYCLELAKHIPADEAWQGDCLYTKEDLKEIEVNGTRYLAFQPNKIIYAFTEDNETYDTIKNTDFGIAFHTIYTKSGKDSFKQSFNVDVTKIDVPDNIYVMSPAINVDDAEIDTASIARKFNTLKLEEGKLLNNQAYIELVNNDTFSKYWSMFENKNISDKRSVVFDVDTFYDDLIDYVNDKLKKEFDTKFSKLKTDRGREAATSKYEASVKELAELLDSHKNVIIQCGKVFNIVADIKMDLWDMLRAINPGYNMFYNSRTKGYIPAESEGVSMSDSDGNIVKIVDRTAFSANNRDKDIIGGWEREDLNEDAEKSNVKQISNDELEQIINIVDRSDENVNDLLVHLDDELAEGNKYGYKWYCLYDNDEPSSIIGVEEDDDLEEAYLVYFTSFKRGSGKKLFDYILNKYKDYSIYFLANTDAKDDGLNSYYRQFDNLKEIVVDNTSLEGKEGMTIHLFTTDMSDEFENELRRRYSDDESLTESKADLQSFVDKFGPDVYDEFMKAKQRFKNKGVSVDLTYHVKHTSPEEMRNLLINTTNTFNNDGDLKGPTKVRGKYDELGEHSGYLMFKPNDYLSSMDLSFNTGWCTGGRYGHYGEKNFTPNEKAAKEQWTKHYEVNREQIFYLLDKDTREGKYAIVIHPNTFPLNVERKDGTKYTKSNFEIYNAEDRLDYYYDNVDKLSDAIEVAGKACNRDIILESPKQDEDYYSSAENDELLEWVQSDDKTEEQRIADFKDQVMIHHNSVNSFAAKIGKNYPEHDFDKLKPEVAKDYSYITQKTRTAEEQKLLDRATAHHIKINPHHHEHWDPNFDEENFGRKNVQFNIDCSKMTKEAIDEMCCDWCAVAKKFHTHPLSWYNKQCIKCKRWLFTDEQKKYIVNRLKELWEGEQITEEAKTTTKETAVVAFGRMGIFTKGHLKLVKQMEKIAKENNADALLYLSHTQDKKKNPLAYESKLVWAHKAIKNAGIDVTVVNSPVKTPIYLMAELYNKGYKNIIYVCGSDRFDEMNTMLNKYNGHEAKPEMYYKFDTLKIVSAGDRDEDSEDIATKASGSMARQCVIDNDFKTFKTLVPFDSNDAKKLYNEVKGGLGLTEMIKEGVRKVNNDADYKLVKEVILSNLPKSYADLLLNIRHADNNEVLRINTDATRSIDNVIKMIETVIRDANETLPEAKVGTLGLYAAVSKTYRSLPIFFNNKEFYVVIGDKAKKLFVPGKVLTFPVNNVSYSQLSSKIINKNGVDLKGIYSSAVTNASPGSGFNKFINNRHITTDFEFASKIDQSLTIDLDDGLVHGLLNDFGEVLGAGCLASVIANHSNSGGDAVITFPDDSNEPLLDYRIKSKNREIKVSEKAGTGAAPSCSSAIDLILDTINSNENFEWKKNVDFIRFIEWMDKYVTRNVGPGKVGIHDGFVNMANVIFRKPGWLKLSYSLSGIKAKGYDKEGSINSGNIGDFVDEIQTLTKIRLVPDKKKVHNKQYCETLRIRYLARLFWLSVNNSPLIDLFNEALADSLGQFIQVYLKSNTNEFKNGILKFHVKTISDSTKFVFKDASGIDSDTCRIGVHKLSMGLK